MNRRTSPFALAAMLTLASAVASAAAPRVAPPAGPLVGKTVGDDGKVVAFLGIPFAQPPVGPLRFRPPQPLQPWTKPRQATAFGPSCPQPPSLVQPVEGPMDEDCLYLNVWRPARLGPAPLPVMVWIHGGGFTTGAGSKPLYEGTELARAGVVTVTVNYRLGPLGFLAHPALSAESPQGVSGNYGLLDQIAALRWVQENIAAFGGDPRCVTVFGESAGAVSVGCLLVSPLSEGLFQRAILQSGTAESIRQPLRDAESVGLDLATRMGIEGSGADAAEALRGRSAEEILRQADPRLGLFGSGTKFWPVVDGRVLPEPPRAILASGKQHDVPVLIGTNADEGTLFTSRQLPVKRALGYRWVLRTAFGESAARVEAMFPASGEADVSTQVNRVITVACFTAPARRTARAVSDARRSPVYLYHFTRACPALAERGLGATHGAEIAYIFGTPPSRFGYTEADFALAATMRQAWVRFAKSGDPNGGDLPRWAPYRTDSEAFLELGDRIAPGEHLWKDACDLFDAVGPLALQPAM